MTKECKTCAFWFRCHGEDGRCMAAGKGKIRPIKRPTDSCDKWETREDRQEASSCNKQTPPLQAIANVCSRWDRDEIDAYGAMAEIEHVLDQAGDAAR